MRFAKFHNNTIRWKLDSRVIHTSSTWAHFSAWVLMQCQSGLWHLNHLTCDLAKTNDYHNNNNRSALLYLDIVVHIHNISKYIRLRDSIIIQGKALDVPLSTNSGGNKRKKSWYVKQSMVQMMRRYVYTYLGCVFFSREIWQVFKRISYIIAMSMSLKSWGRHKPLYSMNLLNKKDSIMFGAVTWHTHAVQVSYLRVG